MLIPIGHDNMSARRWPIITLGLIVINAAVFLGTHWTIERQDPQLWEVRNHILILSARHPQLTLTPNVKEFVDDYRSRYSDDWLEMQHPYYQVIDEWDARVRMILDSVALQAEMDSLANQYSQLMATSIALRYAFIVAHPRPIAYLTSIFLHVGWQHLIGNMWFLWLAGFVLEDVWGRSLYLLVYLAAGAISCQFDAWSDPGRIGYSLGASGAIAGLMGAFLVRFPKKKIRLTWLMFPFHRFSAYFVLPLWVLQEISDGTGPKDGIAHWAHVGGFLFGVAAAVGLRSSGLENKVDKAIEEKVSWVPEIEITRANNMMDRGKLNEAASILNQYLAKHPESFAGWNLLRASYWRESNIPGYRETTGRLCELHLRAREWETAWQDYENFLKAGGESLPKTAWRDFCRMLEERQEFERAVTEYENLAASHPSERQSLLAQLSAARICLNRLNDPQGALRFYEAASASAVPHLDLEPDIESGIRRANTAIAQSEGLVGTTSAMTGPSLGRTDPMKPKVCKRQ
jgi:membrane associated rhomboid family serine protease